MVNEQEEIKLGYLLDPCFELSNTAGKPLTNGWIEVYIHGTRNKYYCYSDFGGTLHPLKIPLDSLGSNIVLADPERAYDVYVYNHFGSLVMSRYNVSPGHAGGAAISSGGNAEHWIGRYGATIPVAANEYSDNIPLPIEPDYEGTFIDHISDNKNIVLKDGLYLVDCLLSFRQNPDSLNNTLGYVHVFTGLDDGESGVFQRNETLPDTDPDELHNIRVQFVRHVEGSTGCNVCFQVRTTNAWSFVRIQSLSIVKLGAGGGIAPQPIEYDAGQYISIDGDVISVTGVQPAGNYADASSVSQGFYDVNQQLNALSGQINEVSGQIPSLDGYATETWVNDQGFLKEVPSEFVTESELNSAISGKADKSEIPSLEGYATEDWVQNQHYLTEVPDNYATDQEVQAAVSGKADKSDIPSLDGYATESYVQSAVSGKQDELEFTYDEDEKITSIDGHEIAGTGGSTYSAGQYISIQNDVISVTGVQPSGEYLVPSDLNGYATDDDVEEATSGKLDASAYVAPMNADWSATSGLGEILNKPSTEEVQFEELDLSSYVQQYEMSGYASKNDLSGKLDTSAYVAPQNADWSSTSGLSQILNKPTTEEVQFEEIDLSSYVQQSDLSGYATHSEVVSATSGLQEQLTFSYNESNEISAINNSAIASGPTYSGGQYISIENDTISVTGLQPQENADWNSTSGISEILNKPNTEEVQFEELNLSAYATQADLVSATSGKQDTLEFGYTSGGSVSAINNSGIYDAPLNEFVNQNSGAWGGEALPVSGGPGVRIRMDNGILIAEADQTVLWEGERGWWADTSELSLSGNISDYNYFKVVYSDDWELNKVIKEYPCTNSAFDVGLWGSEGDNITFKSSKFTVNGTKINLSSSRTIEVNSGGNIPTRNFTTSFIKFYKIIGINRVSGGN